MAAYQMSDADKNTLRSNRMYILKNLTVSEDLLSYLTVNPPGRHPILSDDMKEEIDVEKLRKSKVAKLLDLLPRRGSQAFKYFIYSLMESNHPEVALQLDEKLAEEWEQSQPKEEPKRHAPPPRQQPPRSAPARRTTHKQPSFQHSKSGETEESSFLNPDIVQTDIEDSYWAKQINDTQHNYRMGSSPRGIAVIVNNTYFLTNAPRDGAGFDSMNLCTHLDKLGFTTELYDDLEAQQIKELMIEISGRPEHYDADCLLVFIMSHGSQGYVYGIDGSKVSIQADIVTPFDGAHCEALVNKPKMFFVQACQGDSATQGVPTGDDGDSEVDASPLPEDDQEVTQLRQVFHDLKIQDRDDTLPRLASAHEQSDIVLAYSTVPGYRSWRRTDLGSWFVRAVINVFAAEAHREDVLSLLVKVRQTVSEKQTKPNHEDKTFVQLTRTDETTTKKIYLFPGYVDQTKASRV